MKEIDEQMPRKSPNSRLAALLTETGMSGAELARDVNALGAAQGRTLRYDRTSVAHWLGGSRPRPPVPDLVAQALSRRTARLVTAEDTGLAQPVPVAPWFARLGAAGPDARLAVLCRSESDPGRRGPLLRSSYVLSDPMPADRTSRRPDRVPPRPAQATAGGGGRTGPPATAATAQTLDVVARLFTSLSGAHGGGHARTALAAYLADDACALLAAPATTAVHRDLLVGTARLTHILGTMTTDAGHHGLAQRYYRTAIDLAHESGENTTAAITLRALSTQATLLGHPHHAHQLAEAAIDTAGRTPDPAVRAFVHAQRALTHAHEHRRREALADLTAAESAHDRASSPPGPFTAYPRAGLDYLKAEVLLALKEPEQALTALRDAVRHRSATQHKSYALTHGLLAETLLRIGHLEAACTHWNQFLDHYPHLRSAQARQALDRLSGALAPHGAQRQAAAVRKRAGAFLKAGDGIY
ncbi:tol-pal system YbgF family protein [Streptomyces sp. NPDC057617]|uniref:tetratricopeptide repeat protein n=1 Tax=Streptomyces sp. NPDC057617 TaxID=3346184 RepID=UPI0036CDAA6B